MEIIVALLIIVCVFFTWAIATLNKSLVRIKERADRLKEKIFDIENDIAKLTHPYKFKIGDMVIFPRIYKDESSSNLIQKDAFGVITEYRPVNGGRRRNNYYKIFCQDSSAYHTAMESEIKLIQRKGKKTK